MDEVPVLDADLSATTNDPMVGGLDALDDHWPVAAAQAAHGKGATDLLVMRVGEVLAITDFFVIASASNPRMVKGVVDEIEGRIVEAGGPRPTRIEGLSDLDWVLMDYASFVVHVFLTETRAYYELERLWADVTKVDWITDDMPGADLARGFQD